MKLSEKIMYYRKRAGMNQEMLADRLGVSRQAVSKWETGEAVPELSKVVLLAKIFGVTTDALLLDDEAEETPEPAPAEPAAAPQTSWVEAVPGVIGRLLRRYGWLCGVYIAVVGAFFTLMGAAARGISNSMMNGFQSSVDSMLGGFAGQTVYINGELVNMGSSLAASNPVAMLGGVIIALGVIMIIGGTVLAVVLKKKSRGA